MPKIDSWILYLYLIANDCDVPTNETLTYDLCIDFRVNGTPATNYLISVNSCLVYSGGISLILSLLDYAIANRDGISGW